MTINVQQVFDDLANKKFSSLEQYYKDGGDLNVTGYGHGGGIISLAKAVAATGNAAPLIVFHNLKDDPSIKLYAVNLAVVKALEFKGLVFEDSDLFSQVNNIESLKYLVDTKGLDVTVKSEGGLTLLHRVSPKNMDVIKYLVEEKKLDVNAEDTNGNTPIMQLVREIGQEYHVRDVSKLAQEAHDMCKYFKDNGADINHLNKGESGIKDFFVDSGSYYKKNGAGFDFKSAMPNSSHFDKEYADNLVQNGTNLDISDL